MINLRKKRSIIAFILLVIGFSCYPIVLAGAQEYDPDTFNRERISFASLGGLSPSNTVTETVPGFTNRSLQFEIVFDIPESLYQLENEYPLEYGVSLTLIPSEISPNTTVLISAEWNDNDLEWSTGRNLEFTNYTASSSANYPQSTVFEEKLATQINNEVRIHFMIAAGNISISSVKITVDEESSFIIVNRVRGIADLPSTLLTLLFFSIFAFVAIVIPIWYIGSLKYGWRSPVPYIRRVQTGGDDFLRKITFHDPEKLRKCPACKYSIIKPSHYCPDCGLDLDQGINGIFGRIPFGPFKTAFPYVLGFLILPFALFLPNMAFPVVSGLMLFSIFMAGQTIAIAKPTFEEFEEEILIWKKKGGMKKRLLALFMLAISILSYIRVFIPSFLVSFPLFIIIVYTMTRISASIETADTRLLLRKYQKDLSKVETNLEKWEKGGRLRRAYFVASGRSKERLTKQFTQKERKAGKRKDQLERLEKDFIETQAKAQDWKRTAVYAKYGVNWFSGSLLAFTLGNTYYSLTRSSSLPTLGLPLSRLGFIDSSIFVIVHVMLFTGILLYCFAKDPLKPGLTFLPFQKLKLDPEEGKKRFEAKFYCAACGTAKTAKTEGGKAKWLFKVMTRKERESVVDLAEKVLTPCDECGKWVGEECLLRGGCLGCHPYCTSCGEKLNGYNQAECQVCTKMIINDEIPPYCQACGKEVNDKNNYCYNCGRKYEWKKEALEMKTLST